MATRKKPNPKRIVYLLGAGATQAEVDYLGARPVNLLMRNTDREGVATRVLSGLNARWRLFLGEDEEITPTFRRRARSRETPEIFCVVPGPLLIMPDHQQTPLTLLPVIWTVVHLFGRG